MNDEIRNELKKIRIDILDLQCCQRAIELVRNIK